MMRPPRGVWRFISRNASCVQRKAPVRFVSTTAVQSSSGSSSSGTAGAPIPALLKSTSRRPNLRSTSANSARDRLRITDVTRQSDGSVTRLRGRRLQRLAAPTCQDDREARVCQRDAQRHGRCRCRPRSRARRSRAHHRDPPAELVLDVDPDDLLERRSAGSRAPRARRASKLRGQLTTICRTSRPALSGSGGSHPRRRRSQRRDLLTHRHRHAGHGQAPPVAQQGAVDRRGVEQEPTAARGEACQWRTSSGTGSTAS